LRPSAVKDRQHVTAGDLQHWRERSNARQIAQKGDDIQASRG
jgi:hypothetical protein